MAKIYTKVGDKGSTSLLGGQKVLKNNVKIQAYGTVDELNSFIGSARTELARLVKTPNFHAIESFGKLDYLLEKIQHWLFNLGSLLSAHPDDRVKFNLREITEKEIKMLEEAIDEATSILPPLKEFILPSGSELAVRFHLCRTITRRVERLMIELSDEIPSHSIPFINRLSDYFFTMARFANFKLNTTETTWKKEE